MSFAYRTVFFFGLYITKISLGCLTEDYFVFFFILSQVFLTELRNTNYYYAVKCLKKEGLIRDDDVESTFNERKVLILGTKHPYLCHLFCTFQTEVNGC